MINKLKMHYAYKTTNLINNKVYFGKHTQTFSKIDNYFVNDISITNDIKKYGVAFNCKICVKDKIVACANSSKKVSINGIIYKSVKAATESICELYNISKKEFRHRLLSDNYLECIIST